MDMLQNVTFSHLYWIFLLPAICALADILTGWIQATVNCTWDSTKMRNGLYRKGGELLVVLLAYIICIAMGLPTNVAMCVAAYIVIMELLSVVENLDQAGVPVPVWLVKKLKKAADSLVPEDTANDHLPAGALTTDDHEPPAAGEPTK